MRLRYVSGAAFAVQPALGVQTTPKSLFGQGIDGSDARLLYIPGPVASGIVTLTVTYHIVKADGSDATLVSTVSPEFIFAPGQTVALRLHLTVP